MGWASTFSEIHPQNDLSDGDALDSFGIASSHETMAKFVHEAMQIWGKTVRVFEPDYGSEEEDGDSDIEGL